MPSVASRGVLFGACAGLVVALNDFGAMWLWLDMGEDRWALLSRLLGILVPVGAILAMVSALSITLIQRGLHYILPARLARWSAAHAITLLLAPALAWLASQMFLGGSASRLPAVWALKPVAAITLIGGTWIASAAITHWITRANARQSAVLLGTALLVVAHLLIKLNQWVLPNLYGYLHSALAVTAFVAIAVGIAVVAARSTRARGLIDRLEQRPYVALLLLLPLLIALVGSVRAIPNNQNVAVAMLDARASHARSVLLAAAPLLQPERTRRLPRTAARRDLPAKTQPGLSETAHRATNAHVLLITIDALRADHLGTYGYARPTSPGLDRLAKESLVFERAYAQAPHSSYSLSSLMTSEYLHETLDLGAPPPEATLATSLGAVDYQTAAFYTLGIFHTAAERLGVYEKNAFGFALHDHRDREPEALTDRVLEEIDRSVAQGEPNTLIWAHYFNVHEPYRATTFGESDMDRYDSEIVRADAAVERLIREARQRFTRDMIVVITADHGEEFRDHGGVYHGSTLYDEQVRVPLIIHVPNVTPRRIAAPVEVIDIAPTLLGFLDVPAPSTMRGDDLRAYLDNDSDAPPVFSAVIHKRMVVKWPHKLIADLRFGLYELYALDRDPHERKNLAGTHPDLLAELRDDVYAWLDSLASSDTAEHDPHAVALDQGRLGDRRAVPTLLALIQDDAADTAARREAGVILGKLADPISTTGLISALRAKDPLVAAEAAIALGRMHHKAGLAILQGLVLSEDPDIRVRAAVSLGRLRDNAAVPALIDALWIAPNDYEREEAIRWLGRLRDSRALEPLISLLPESRTRHLVVIALGALGDRRAFDTLRDVLRWEDNATVRDAVVRGIGLLKDPRGLDLVLPLVATEPTLKNTSESLVRLDALERGMIGGSDLVADAKLHGFARCTSYSERHDWDYLHRTVCETTRAQTSIDIRVPGSIADSDAGASVVLGVRRLDGQDPATLQLHVGDQQLADISVDAGWQEYRWVLEAGALKPGRARVTLVATPPDARFVVDHVLVLPP